jgi:hypothetical protein
VAAEPRPGDGSSLSGGLRVRRKKDWSCAPPQIRVVGAGFCHREHGSRSRAESGASAQQRTVDMAAELSTMEG